MNADKYCCSLFRFDHELDHRIGPNIRVIKVEYPLKVGILSSTFYRFYLTVGYEVGAKNVASRPIKHCPYCGVNLGKKYQDDSIINESDHTFIMVPPDEEKITFS